jgi:hypothetical protein
MPPDGYISYDEYKNAGDKGGKDGRDGPHGGTTVVMGDDTNWEGSGMTRCEMTCDCPPDQQAKHCHIAKERNNWGAIKACGGCTM